MKYHNQSSTRKGAASFYVVIFAALVFTVIVISFIRLMVSESSQNIANDLSQSAYDSALTGIEDAKTAISICQENNSTPGCQKLYKDECNAISDVLGYGTSSSNSEQSYSCVILAKDLDNYKISLSATNPVAVVPIDDAKSVKISWFSLLDKENSNNNQFRNYSNGNNTAFLNADNAIIPPVVSVGFIEKNTDRINNITLRPSSINPDGTNTFNPQQAYNAAAAQTDNKPAYIQCSTSSEPACSAQVTAKKKIQYLVLSLPYHQTNSVGFTIQKYNDNNFSAPLTFTEQISVDSTGRANDYYRRVESRLQLAPINFPYPEYALSASGSDPSNGSIEKNFWVTNNCWSTKGGSLTTSSSPCQNKNANTI